MNDIVKLYYLQSDFEGCADILTSDRTLQKVTIEPMKPNFFKQSLGVTCH
jgi:hypothetical protein